MALPVTITGIATTISPAGPFKSSGGNYYFFGRDGTTATTLQAYKATAPDTSWASIATKTGFATSVNYLSSYQVGDIIHMIVTDGTTTSTNHKYQTFDMSSDTFVTAETINTALDTRNASSAAEYNSAIVVRSAGEVVVLYNGTRSGTNSQIAYRRRTAVNTWAAGVAVSTTGTDCQRPQIVLGTADLLHFLWYNTTNTLQRHLTSANVLGTAASTGATGITADVSRRDDAGTIRCVGITTSSTYRWNSGTNPTVTNSALTFSNASRITNTGGIFYALYRLAADSDLYIKTSSDNGATWGTAISALVGTVGATVENLSRDVDVYTRGATVFPYLVNDGGVWKYNEYALNIAHAWNALGKSTQITLSNGDRTAINTVASADSVVFSTQLRTGGTAGKYYAEFFVDASASFIVGTQQSGDAAGSFTNSTNIESNTGDVYKGPTLLGSIGGSVTTGDVICIAWDAGTETFWARKNGGNWNNSGTANPATATGGFDVSSLPNTDRGLWLYTNNTTAQVTVRTRNADLTVGFYPSGFTTWMGETLPTADAWSSYDKSANITLSNSDKTATSTSSTAAGVRSTQFRANEVTGKYYAEFLVGSTVAFYHGLHSASGSVTDATTGFLLYTPTGDIILNGSAIGAVLGTVVAGDVVCLAWDAGNERGWYRRNGGNWNNSGTANPATNTGGVDISVFTAGNFALWGYTATSGAAIGLRTETADLTVGSYPSGFTSWMGEALAGGVTNYTMPAGTGTVALAGQAATLTPSWITFRSVSSTTYASRTNTVVTAPAGIVDGDILIATLLVNAAAPAAPTPPAGFTQIGFQTSVTDGSTTSDLYIWWKRAAGESGSYTFTHAAQSSQGAIAAYSYCVASGNPVDANATNYSNTGSVGSVFAVTTTVPSDALIYVGHDSTGGGALTPPTGMIERFDSRVYIADEHQTPVGSSGTRAMNLGGSGPWAANLFALKPFGASAVTNYTLTAATGTVALSGQTATLKRAYVMPAATGTLALSGQTAIARYGHKTAAGLGTLTLAGQTAALRYGHVATAASGAVVLNGQSASLLYGGAKALPAATGTFALSGQTAKLGYGRKFPIVTGTVTLSGQAAILRYGRVVTAVKGTFTLNGIAAVLRYSHVLSATTGAFTLSGQPVTLRYSRKMPAATGAFALNGRVANLIYSGSAARVLPAAPGVVVLSGKAATFRQTAVVKALAGAFTLAGQAAALQLDRRLTAAPGQVLLSGKTAAFYYARVLSASSGTFNLTGMDANLVYVPRVHYMMPIDAGAFVLAHTRVDLIWDRLPSQPGILNFGRRVTIPNRW